MKRLTLALGLVLFTLACVPGQRSTPPDGASVPGVSTDALAAATISVEGLGPGAARNSDLPTVDPASAAPALPGRAGKSPRPRPEGLTATAEADPDTAGPAAAADPPAAGPAPKPSSPEEAACLRRGDLWIHAGKSIAMTCVRITGDAGKQCRREQDCQGQCLARSMTCAPYDPLFGCNEVLQNDGSRVTLCID